MRSHPLHASISVRRRLLAVLAVVLAHAGAGPHFNAVAQTTAPTALLQSAAAGQRVEVPPMLQARDRLELVLSSGTAYVRTLTLHYAAPRTTPVTSDMPVRRLVISGDSVATLPLSADGRRLVAVTVASDPSSISADTALAFRADATRDADATAPVAAGTTAINWPASQDSRTQKNAWALAGSARVEPASDRHVVPVGRDKGPIERLTITARGGAAAITKIRLVPLSSDPIELTTSSTLSAMDAPLEVRLETPDTLREVVVFGDPRRPAERGTVIEVRAITREGWAGADGENRLKTGGWVLLGTATLSSASRERPDRAAFAVPGAEGTFQRLRLVARRQAVTMLTVTLDAGDGKQQILPVHATLRPEAAGHQVVLPTSRTSISSIKLEPVIRYRQSIDADIEVWAQY